MSWSKESSILTIIIFLNLFPISMLELGKTPEMAGMSITTSSQACVEILVPDSDVELSLNDKCAC
ncbi:hypothetical protein KC19_9G179700 [Ceratodon purpureus]|uniref:Uncharacterized protein n=1 Tax=Ceratodon purpureus TaxID=3225 RepID=A0A8T0GT82_CERPU|nr:hypothetical protein KC19_9G179700 [Ceratodon purpureus]